MDLTQGSIEMKTARAKKMMLWFGMISVAMMFAGLTSAYVVSKSRPDWVSQIDIPNSFLYSTIAIILSSITFFIAKKEIQKNRSGRATSFLLATFVLGLIFVFLQFKGFSQFIEAGFYFTGSESTITTSFLYAIIFSHLVHLFGGLLVLLVVIYNHFKEKYKPGQTLGLELGAMFWHFLDFLWVYLIVFFYFFR